MQDRELCKGCVYFVDNLPKEAYSEEDWKLIRELECSVGATPGDQLCEGFRKSSCKLVNLSDED